MRHLAPIFGSILPLGLRIQPPFHFFWFSHSLGKPIPGLVSTLLNQAYSTPSRLVQTFLHVTEQVWHPMHLSRFSTMPICARTFILPPPLLPADPANRPCSFSARSRIRRGCCQRCRNS